MDETRQEDTREYNRKYRATHKEELKRYAKEYADSHRKQRRASGRKYAASRKGRAANHRLNLKTKQAVLTHYGPNGVLRCSWDGCDITDLDMLTLDHINNDGHVERKGQTTRRGGGVALYGSLRKEGYPSGYQTLCCNHQMKKELLHRRAQMEKSNLDRN